MIKIETKDEGSSFGVAVEMRGFAPIVIAEMHAICETLIGQIHNQCVAENNREIERVVIKRLVEFMTECVNSDSELDGCDGNCDSCSKHNEE